MKYNSIPHTDLNVSEICLGSMTWGEQNSQEEAHQQIAYAFENGVNFIDTAEMYSFPGRKETQGSSERIIGQWLAKNGKRDALVLASKILGPNRGFRHLRDDLSFSKENIAAALHDSLKRLQTDYIDVYQLHWPERNTNYFGRRDYKHRDDEMWEDNFAEIIYAMQQHINEGKIRYFGISNENPWGLMRYLEESRKGLPRVATVQNSYSLINRKDEVGLTEILHRENVGYLAYSPLGFGQLTGKYLDNTPQNSRYQLFPNYSRYHKPNAYVATKKYKEIAEEHGLSLTQMALAFVRQKPFVHSTIIGNTSMEQLKENLGSMNIVLSEEVLKAIDAIHESIPNPAP